MPKEEHTMSYLSKLSTALFVIFLLTGCIQPFGGPSATATPTASPTPEATPTVTPEGWGSVSVVSSTLYEDSYGDYIVAGLIFNGTEQAVERIKLTLRAADSAGKSVLSKDFGTTFVDTLQVPPSLEQIPSGGYTPFEYTINTGDPATYSVEISSSSPSTDEFFPVNVENAQLLYGGDGDYYLAGELVNPNPFMVKVEGLAGVILDAEGEVKAADEIFYHGAYLLPAGDPSGLDRLPFGTHIYGPLRSFSGFAVYPLAIQEETEEEVAYTATVTHTFVDNLGKYHVVGQVTSNTVEQLGMPKVMAALYDADGLAIAVYEQYSNPGLRPGETGTFDLYSFQAVSNVDGLAGRVADVRVAINPGGSFDAFNVYTLDTTGVTRQYFDFGPSWYFTGYAVNTSDVPQGSATVSVDVYDADDRLVGTGFGYTRIGDEVPVGGTMGDWELYVFLDPALDPATLRYEVIAWAE